MVIVILTILLIGCFMRGYCCIIGILFLMLEYAILKGLILYFILTAQPNLDLIPIHLHPLTLTLIPILILIHLLQSIILHSSSLMIIIPTMMSSKTNWNLK